MEKNMTRLIETLIRGRNSAERLQNLLRRKVNDDGSVSVDDLIMEILGSFSGGLSVLSSCDSGEFCGFPASPQVGLACSVDPVPEVNTSKTGKKPATALKERRGCYKRRKTIDSRVNVSATIEDGYAWRKYGQKEILNSKFPRCYFRCTHKHIHGCKALKQVQKLEDESNMFHITYFGHHTCPTPNSGFVLHFENSKNHPCLSSSPSTITNSHIDPALKPEDDSKVRSDDQSDNVSSANDAQSSHALAWREMLIDDLRPCQDALSFMGFDHEDSSASTSSHGYFDIDFFMKDGFLSDVQFNNDVPFIG